MSVLARQNGSTMAAVAARPALVAFAFSARTVIYINDGQTNLYATDSALRSKRATMIYFHSFIPTSTLESRSLGCLRVEAGIFSQCGTLLMWHKSDHWQIASQKVALF